LRTAVKYTFLLSLVFNLISCKPSSYFETKNSSISLDDSYSVHSQTDLLIQPYKAKLDTEMNQVLVFSAEEFPKERGKPETKLGNFVADLSLMIANELYNPADGDSIDFCLLNFGGLRTSLPKGEITQGKIFELMPFENQLVVITIEEDKLKEVTKYIKAFGGQPIAGDYRLKFVKKIKSADSVSQSDSIWHHTLPSESPQKKEIKILTSDYLANGGDNMKFFLNPIKYEPVGIKLRDAIIQYCIQENKKGKQLTGKLDGRVTFE
jgi:2',3'-cyclic-nucleotide 2'-phosphodiesterase (5'-nucleotidase family)